MPDGKAAKDKGESEDLPGLDGVTFADWGDQRILRIKKGNPRIDLISVWGFLFAPDFKDTEKLIGKETKMKTGAIVYVAGKNNLSKDLDMELALKNLEIDAEKIEFVSSGLGHFDIMDAWWLLTTKGMKRIVCLIAEIINGSELRLTGREIQLCE